MDEETNWRRQAGEIITAALRAVEPERAVRRHVRRDGQWLRVADRRYDLDCFDRILVVGAGKAGSPMARAVADLLGDRLTTGLVNVRHGHVKSFWQVAFGSCLPASDRPQADHPLAIEINEAGHPTPDAAGEAGAERIFELIGGLSERDMVICLLSGGASALLPLPASGLSLQDLRALTDLLLRSGAPIDEMNSVRKHCSRITGGQMARRAAPATLVSLILSDVVGSPLDTIASGPTVPDRTTFADAYAVLERYDVVEMMPPAVVAHLRRGMAGEIADTPKEGDPCFARVQNVLIGDNRLAARAAQAQAESLGFRSLVLTTYAEGEAREVARVCAALAKEMVTSGSPVPPPACLIVGGETTVTVRGQGQGGRNQELALAAALALEGWERVMVVSLATDGIDGLTDAAGAVATGSTIPRARSMGLDPLVHLANNDSYPFFAALEDLILTGPTHTNVNDLIFLFAF